MGVIEILSDIDIHDVKKVDEKIKELKDRLMEEKDKTRHSDISQALYSLLLYKEHILRNRYGVQNIYQLIDLKRKDINKLFSLLEKEESFEKKIKLFSVIREMQKEMLDLLKTRWWLNVLAF